MAKRRRIDTILRDAFSEAEECEQHGIRIPQAA